MQHLATAQEIFATSAVLRDPAAAGLLSERGLNPMTHNVALRGITNEISIFAIP
ncbi:hypothetical protein D3C71_2019010 [compost metagenome]